jgi:PAS domain S-box-containing protein
VIHIAPLRDLTDNGIPRNFARLIEHVPEAFAVVSGVEYDLVLANAAFRSILKEPVAAVIHHPIAEAFASHDTRDLIAALDRVRMTGIGESDVRVSSRLASDLALVFTISPDGGRGESDLMMVGLTVWAPGGDALALQRQVAERMLLSAMHERDLAENAEGSRERASYVASAGRRLTSSLEERATLREMSMLSLSRAGTWCIVDVFGPDETMQRLAIFHPDPAKQKLTAALEPLWVPRPGDPFGLPAILRDRAPVVIDDRIGAAITLAAHDKEVLAILEQLGIGPLLTMPLIAHDRVIGAITFVGPQESDGFTGFEVQVAQELAERSARALDNAQIHADAVSSRRNAEISSKRYGALVKASAQIVWTTNGSGAFVSEQKDWAAFTGQTFEEYSGNGWLDAVHPDDRPATFAAWQRALETNTACELEHRVRRSDGVYRRFEVRAVPVFDNRGTVSEWIGAESDVTERRAAERDRDALFRAEGEARTLAESAQRDAEVANRSKSEFLAAMSHELRTPLNAIAGYVQLLEMGVHGPVTEAQKQALSRVKKSEEHLLSLINDVLNFAKIEAGRVTYLIDDVVVAEALDDVEQILRAQFHQKRLTFENRTSDKITVRADSEKLRQILLNLLSNAIKFTEPGGHIETSASEGTEVRDGETTPCVFIRVCDNGIGIPPEKQEIVFDPFIQVHRDLKRPTEGTGLGLAISRDLAQGMNGDLSVKSAEGEGSTFTLSLPRA